MKTLLSLLAFLLTLLPAVVAAAEPSAPTIGATLAEGIRDWRWYLLLGGLAVFLSIRALMAVQWVIIALLQGVAVASIFSVIVSLFSDNDTILLAVSSIGIVVGVSHIAKLNKKYKP